MKNHIAILIGALALCSCEDYLTQENPNKIESEYYFTDESSLEIYTNGFIRSFATAIKSFVDGDKNADTHSWDGQAAYFMDNYSADDATNWTTSNWSQLRSINYYLDNMRNAVASDAILDHYEGVGRFFRALFYIDKVQTFGAVPWYDTSIDATDQEALFKDRDNREYVCRKILAALDYACTYCSPAASYRNQASYIHRYVALALKARFCLYEGTMRKYHTLDPSTGRPWQSDESAMYLGECVKACEAIIGDGVYHLTDNAADRRTQYRAMFIESNATTAYANEIIWARNYDSELNVTHYMNSYFINQQYANYAFTRQFINTYLMTDGTPFTDKYPDYDSVDFTTECSGRDYRLAQTIRTPGFTRDGGTTQWAPDVTFSKTGYQPIKWLTDDSSKDTNTSKCDNDVPLMRYAEVLLNYAEAKAELGSLSPDDLNITVNEIRSRVGMPALTMRDLDKQPDWYLSSEEYGYPNVTGSNEIVNAILEIRRERTVELIQEGFRLQDLYRWKAGYCIDQAISGMYFPGPGEYKLAGKETADLILYKAGETKPQAGEGVSVYELGSDIILSEGDKGYVYYHKTVENLRTPFNEERDYLYPIPSGERSLNPNLTQNPGWSDGLDF